MTFIHQHHMPGCTVVLLGRQPHIIQTKRCEYTFSAPSFLTAASIASAHGAQPHKICLIKAASGAQSAGFSKIVRWQPTESRQWHAADGVLMDTAASAAMFQTADCPTVVIANKRTGYVTMFHCGRPAGTPQDGQSIITQALEIIATDDADIELLEVYITGAIAGAHFRHSATKDARAKALPFLDEYGPEVFHDVDLLALDMVRVITLTLLAAGLTDKQIQHDGLDTFTHEGLVSYRQATAAGEILPEAQTVIVIKH